MCYIFPPQLINAPALHCETENTDIVSIHVNVLFRFASRHTKRHIGIIT